MRKNVAPQSISAPIEVSTAEGRKATLECEVLSLTESKKKLQDDVALLVKKQEVETKKHSNLVSETEVYKKNKEDAALAFSEYRKGTENEKNSLVDSVIQEEKKLEKLKQDEVILSESLVKLSEKKKVFEHDLESVSIDISTHELKKTECENEIKNLGSDLEAVKKDIKDSLRGLEEIEKEKESLENTFPILKQAISDLENEITLVSGALADKKAELVTVGLELDSVREKIKTENASLLEITKTADERTSIAVAAENRVQEKTHYLLKLIEKAQAEKLIGDFKI